MADPVIHVTNGIPDSGTGNITTLGQTLLDGANATHGITTGAAVITDAPGTLQQYLRGLVKLFAAALAAGGRLFVQISDGTNSPAIKAASTAPVATDPAIVVAIHPLSVNANVSDGSAQTSAAHVGAPTVNMDQYSQYETVAASQTDQIMGASGAQYDYIAGLLIIPGTAAAGAVSIKDGNGSAISVFAGGGTTALPSLAPFLVPLGLHCLAGTTPGWKITTGANVTAIGIGKFT